MVPQPSGKAIDCNSVIAGSNLAGTSRKWGCGGMVDAKDLKSFGRNTVRVQLPPSPPLNLNIGVTVRPQLNWIECLATNQEVASSILAGRAINTRDVAQLGRVLDLGSRCHRFESCHPDHLFVYYGEVAQLARAIGSYPVGRGFESHPRYHYLDPQLSWSELPAHNRVVKGSSPLGSTIQNAEVPKWLKGPVLKTGRSCKRRLGSNPSFCAIHREVEQPGSSSGS